MFEAWVMVCVMGQAGNCFPAQDTRGPYETEGQCVMRAHEMVAQMRMAFPMPHTYQYKCVEQSIKQKGISLRVFQRESRTR